MINKVRMRKTTEKTVESVKKLNKTRQNTTANSKKIADVKEIIEDADCTPLRSEDSKSKLENDSKLI